MYGSFNCITFDHATVSPRPLLVSGQCMYKQPLEGAFATCSIWGPTCDSIDCIGREFNLPVMQVGDFMYFDNMGAYTMCAASQL